MPISPFGPAEAPQADSQLDWTDWLYRHDRRLAPALQEAVGEAYETLRGDHWQKGAPFKGVIPLDNPRKLDGPSLIQPRELDRRYLHPPVTQEEGKKGERYIPNLLDWMSHFRKRKLLPQGDK